ncbi:MAG: hypothetical protein M3133_06895 [Actinomycetota bacterium]|nr:hypothetical protein [Actinomycetota bacterium]
MVDALLDAITLPLAFTGVHQRAQAWVVVLAWISLGLGFASSLVVL